MLFKTVYGAELGCIHQFLLKNGPTEKEVLYQSFLPLVDGELGSRTNIDDALIFLISSQTVIKNKRGKFEVVADKNFKLRCLKNIRQIQIGNLIPIHKLDPWYFGLLDELYIRPNQVMNFSLHQKANTTNVSEVLSEERINAWRRVLEYFRLGRRVMAGFMCSYDPQLVWEIFLEWEKREGPLEEFLEEHFTNFLPWKSSEGDISQALRIPLLILEKEGFIKLDKRQDSPFREYMGASSVKWITKERD